MSKIEQAVEAAIKEPVEALGYELADVEFKKENGEWVLTLYIWNQAGVSLDDCEKVTMAVDPILDELDPIEQQYFFSVSSVGLDRPFKKPRDFERNIGNEISVKLYAPINGKKEFVGVLLAYGEQTIEVKTDRATLSLALKQVAQAKPYIKF